MKIFLLVGIHYNRPAKVLLASMIQDTTVELRREPENPYDEHAVAVYVDQQLLDVFLLEQLVGDLEASGYTLRDVVRQPKWKLGHMGASGGKPLLKAMRETGTSLLGNRDLLAAYDGDLPVAKCHQGMDGTITLRIEDGEAK